MPHGGVDHGIDVAAVLVERCHDLQNQHEEREDKETRRIIRKIDIRLLPVLAVIYSFALIDRVNLPNVGAFLNRPLSRNEVNLLGSYCRYGRRPRDVHRKSLLPRLNDILRTIRDISIPSQHRYPQAWSGVVAFMSCCAMGMCFHRDGVYKEMDAVAGM